MRAALKQSCSHAIAAGRNPQKMVVISRSYSSLDKSTMQRTVVNGEADVTSLNALTGDRLIARLSIPQDNDHRSRRFRRQFVLPKEAIAGLREAIVKCDRNRKQLQNEADQIAEKIANRRFPASPELVKEARKKLREKINKKLGNNEETDFLDINMGDQVRDERERQTRNMVDKELKKTHFNWKPMEADSKEAATAYALARLAPNYAEVARVLEEIQYDKNLRVESVLDFGSGCGGAFWAVWERFGSTLREYCAVDANDHMTRMAMDAMKGAAEEPENTPSSSSPSSPHNFIHKGLSFRRHLLPSLQTTYDVVICHRTLIEIASQEGRFQLAESLWKRSNKFLILIESGLEDSFSALMDTRNYILNCGHMLDKEKTEQLLKEHGRWNEVTESLLHGDRLSDYERLEIMRQQLPPTVTLPTLLPTATVVAPCPHDLGCPKHAMSKSCPFTVRWQPLRADGKSGRAMEDGSEKGSISFTILEKATRDEKGPEPLARILESRKLNGHMTCDVCTAFKGLQRFTVSKRAGEIYKRIKERRQGELLPVDMTTVQCESEFDVYEKALKRAKAKKNIG